MAHRVIDFTLVAMILSGAPLSYLGTVFAGLIQRAFRLPARDGVAALLAGFSL